MFSQSISISRGSITAPLVYFLPTEQHFLTSWTSHHINCSLRFLRFYYKLVLILWTEGALFDRSSTAFSKGAVLLMQSRPTEPDSIFKDTSYQDLCRRITAPDFLMIRGALAGPDWALWSSFALLSAGVLATASFFCPSREFFRCTNYVLMS